jgi:ribosome-binding factor A
MSTMTQGARPARVSEELREVLAEELPRLKDPRIGFVTITGVKMTPDLRVAWVYYTAFGDERERSATRAGLRSATPHLRSALGRQVRLKFLPEIHFEEDDAIERAEHIEAVLRRLREDDGER